MLCWQEVKLGRLYLLDDLISRTRSLARCWHSVVLGAVAALFRHLRGIDGLGLGAQKFSFAAGLWIGWEEIAPMMLIASCSALVFVTIRSAKERKHDVAARVPFGPFLGLGTVVCWSAAVV